MLLILVWAAILSACGPKSRRGHSISGIQGTTGGSDANGQDFIANGDGRMDTAVNEPDPDPELPDEPAVKKAATKAPPPSNESKTAETATPETKAPEPQKQAPAQNTAGELKARLREIEFHRFNKGETSTSRNGSDHVAIRLIFDNRPTVQFKGQLQGTSPKFTFKFMHQGHTLSGEFTDVYNSAQTLVQTEGELRLTEHATRQTARILLFAFMADVKLREDREQKVAAGSKLEKLLKELGTDSFGWVYNWSVVRGPAFYLIDFVKLIAANQALPPTQTLAFSVQGESLRTGEEVYEAKASNNAHGKVKLIGNGETAPVRMFAIESENPETKENQTLMMDVSPNKEVRPVTRKDSQDQQVATADEQAENPEEDTPSTPTSTPAPTPRPRPDSADSTPVAPAGKSFLRISTAKPRPRKITEDLARNRNIPGVKAFIEEYTNGGGRKKLATFFNFANPFRKIIETIAAAYEVSPAFAYLTIVESPYFYGGKYAVVRPLYTSGPKKGQRISSALGPFQLLLDTAEDVGMHVGNGEGRDDERRFFVPSACGAAKYNRQLVEIFDDSDSTVSILGYFRGQGGAAAAIFCSYSKEVTNRKACAERINVSFTSNDYNRFLKLAKRFNYSYAEMDRLAAISPKMRDYVNAKLAVYFIANDLTKHKFDLSRAETGLPSNGTVKPARMKDPTCTQAAALF